MGVEVGETVRVRRRRGCRDEKEKEGRRVKAKLVQMRLSRGGGMFEVRKEEEEVCWSQRIVAMDWSLAHLPISFSMPKLLYFQISVTLLASRYPQHRPQPQRTNTRSLHKIFPLSICFLLLFVE